MVKKVVHIIFGVGTAIYLCNPPPEILMWCGMFALLGSIFPDFDLKHKHRMLLHNVFSLFILSILLAFLFRYIGSYNLYYIWSFIIGYVSHLFSDMFTKAGVALFYPLNSNRVRVTRVRYDNPLINIFFVVIGLLLIIKYAIDSTIIR